MKDVEVREIVLNKFYEKRGDGTQKYFPKKEDFSNIEIQDIHRACGQLFEQGLLQTFKAIGTPITDCFGIISSQGVDVVEGNIKPQSPPLITNITVGDINKASNLIIGNNNAQLVETNIRELIEAVNKVNAPIEDKKSALKLLKAFVSHPLVTTVLGASISLFSDDLS